MTVGGAAALASSDALIRKARSVGAQLLQAPFESIRYEAGRVRRASTNQALSLGDIVAQGHPLTVLERARAELTFPNGCHVAEIDVDPDTGVAQFVSFVAVDDVGNCIEPTLVEGQVIGGVAQALGQVLVEEARFDPADGQLLTGSLMDYALPRADNLTHIRTEHLVVPCVTNPLGTKGAGEAGTTGALAAGYNALASALRSAGVEAFAMPATPPRVWAALQAARNGSGTGTAEHNEP
jgi:carbon-monoxide dehydrogenase large subunit